MIDLSEFNLTPVMDYPEELFVFDLSERYDPEFISSKSWAIGKYNEKRTRMYTADQYEGKRNIHMGIDIWTNAGAPVYAFYDGELAYKENHAQKGNYGPTLVTRHEFEDTTLFALYGHLSEACLDQWEVGQSVEKGEKIAELGEEKINGGWVPHLHFQISIKDPGEADMPGVVADEFHEQALKLYPDPRIVLGDLY
ncbi:peptidoglycan DD-metalloendopeptidase family protein [Halalkalibaculum roseum]|nr:peptidoglycan DD-metalloendopeptidase family protein [Halalkalibaculum roseum]